MERGSSRCKRVRLPRAGQTERRSASGLGPVSLSSRNANRESDARSSRPRALQVRGKGSRVAVFGLDGSVPRANSVLAPVSTKGPPRSSGTTWSCRSSPSCSPDAGLCDELLAQLLDEVVLRARPLDEALGIRRRPSARLGGRSAAYLGSRCPALLAPSHHRGRAHGARLRGRLGRRALPGSGSPSERPSRLQRPRASWAPSPSSPPLARLAGRAAAARLAGRGRRAACFLAATLDALRALDADFAFFAARSPSSSWSPWASVRSAMAPPRGQCVAARQDGDADPHRAPWFGAMQPAAVWHGRRLPHLACCSGVCRTWRPSGKGARPCPAWPSRSRKGRARRSAQGRAAARRSAAA